MPSPAKATLQSVDMARFAAYAARFAEIFPKHNEHARHAVRAILEAQIAKDPHWREHPAVLRLIKDMWIEQGYVLPGG